MEFCTRHNAEALLLWAHEQNPGPWKAHSETVARMAETIAAHCKLDMDKAYIFGLLHDIGRYEGVRGLHHIYAGYELLKQKEYPEMARICLTHSFPYQDIGAYGGGQWDCTDDEIEEIRLFLDKAVYDDYDKLIQLCDSMGMAEGVCMIEKRLVDVVRRYGFNEFTLRKWDSTLALKTYFDEMCQLNIYDLFYDEIRHVSFG